MKLVFALVLVSAPLCLTMAASDGNPGTCDNTLNIFSICTASRCVNDKKSPFWIKPKLRLEGRCCPPGMHKVTPPIPSAAYELTTSAVGGKYTPCQKIKLTLTVKERDKKFLGLFMYAAKNSSPKQHDGTGDGDKVGTMEVHKTGGKDMFHIPPNCWNNGGGSAAVVMHANADVKPYVNTFTFNAPEKGTGTIVFRVMVKHGETNGGDFYYPQKTVVLTEDTAQPTVTWVKTTKDNPTCDAACANIGGQCDDVAMKESESKSGNLKFLAPERNLVCDPPYFSMAGEACDFQGMLSKESRCYYRDDNKCTEERTPDDYCRTPRHETLDHMCACKGSTLPQTCPKSETVMKLELMTQNTNTMKSMELSRERYEEKLAKTAVELESIRLQIKSGDTSDELLQREARLESEMSRLKLQIGRINSEYDDMEKNIGTVGDDSSGESGDGGLSPAIYGAAGGGFALVAVVALVAIKRRKAASPDAPRMGNEWAMHKDPQSNRLYWHNPKTGETRWDDYAEYVDKASGKMYWHNTRTGETTWASPFAKNKKSENPLLNHGKTDSEFNNPMHAVKDLPNTKPSLRRRMSSSIRRKV